MRFRGLDLNLLVAFNSLLETRSVSRAAEQLNLSQPAMSAALARLRGYFGDEILVAKGKRMYPTAYAEALLPQVQQALAGIDALISTSTEFDPRTSKRTFRIAASDYLMVAVLVPFIADLAERAPGIRIENIMPSDDSVAQIGEGKLDLLIAPEQFVSPEHPSELLLEERHVVVGWDRNPLVAKRFISEDEFSAAGHVMVAFGRHRTLSFADRQMERLGKQRRIEAVTASFATVPWLLRRSSRIAVMHERLAKAMAEHFPIRSAPIPFDFPIMREMIQYHEARRTDDGLAWLRSGLHSAVEPHHKQSE